jgi:hypothetical protein
MWLCVYCVAAWCVSICLSMLPNTRLNHNILQGRWGVGASLSQPVSMYLGSRQEATNDVGLINSGPYMLYKISPHDKPMQAQRGGGGTGPTDLQHWR